jgi:hypothetical protein
MDFEEDINTGYCFTPCPYGRDAMVNSAECSKCIHNFGTVENKLKCTGHRDEKRKG